MVPYVLFTMDIIAEDPELTEEAFREAIAPCLNRLRDLKGSFDRNTDITTVLRRSAQDDGHGHFVMRVVLGISVGMVRAEHLLKVYDAYAELIAFELPDCKVQAAGEILKFQPADKPGMKKS